MSIAPLFPTPQADIKKTEPYVYSQFIAGDESPEFGRARNSWLTGSASWNLVAAHSYILGIRPDYQGLIIDPCIPKKWKGFKVRRFFRGSTYDIEVANPKHVSKGVASIKVDNREIKENILPVFNDGKVHRVCVTLGEPLDE